MLSRCPLILLLPLLPCCLLYSSPAGHLHGGGPVRPGPGTQCRYDFVFSPVVFYDLRLLLLCRQKTSNPCFGSFAVTGFDLWGAVLAMGLVCTLYTALVSPFLFHQ